VISRAAQDDPPASTDVVAQRGDFLADLVTAIAAVAPAQLRAVTLDIGDVSVTVRPVDA
jgi:hypothetical protein